MSKLAAVAKQLTSSGVVTTVGTPGRLHGYSLKCGTDANASVTFLDGGSGGTARWQDGNILSTTAAGDSYIRCTFPTPIQFTTDIYAVLTGTNSILSVEYEET